MTVQRPVKLLKVAIVGGGPGGLSTAIALSQIPHVEVALYEQAKVLSEVGAGISIGPNTWNVLELLGVAILRIWCLLILTYPRNGKTGEEVHRIERAGFGAGKRPNIRTQRTKLQSALLSHVKPGVIHLSKKLVSISDEGENGVELQFQDGTVTTADLVVGADGIRSVVRDAAWSDYEIKFTGTTIWRALLPWDKVKRLDDRFDVTAWWHGPTTHVYFSPVGEGLGEIAARAWHDPAVHSASKVSWGVPVAKDHVESHFQEYLPQVREVLGMVTEGDWREFAAFSGPELSQLTAWDNKIVLVGDSSHALSGAFGSGAGLAMEDGYILARALEYFRNDVHRAVPLFDAIRLPYYSRMYEYLAGEAQKRVARLRDLGDTATYDDQVKVKIIKGGADMSWIYNNDIGSVWKSAVEELTAKDQ
ncbi:putative FAD-binding monooxygenase [Coniochaeta sp. 2T2.1]|nr:putative FAD-binding monooxygenase [Coniochaeta sp. 2T2.1]